MTPFVLQSGSQFRPGGPPAITSAQYTADFNEVKSLGSATSTTRTADQTQLASFWSDAGGTETPPGHWNTIASSIALAQSYSVYKTVAMFHLLNMGLADAGIAAWDAKNTYDNWRPLTAIRNAASDGNPDTTADASWTPLWANPPFQDYVSGHSTFSSTAATILEAFVGTNYAFTSSSDPKLGSITRSFTSLRDAAQEAGYSRVIGGIHFNFSNLDGATLGNSVGQYLLTQKLAGAKVT